MYQKQIIIDLLSDNGMESPQAKALREKWGQMHPNEEPCTVVSLKEFLDLNEELKVSNKKPVEETAKLRLYVIGHHTPENTETGPEDSDYLATNKDKGIHYEAIARVSDHLIGKKDATINLISCQAGIPDQTKYLSFGAKLLKRINGLRKEKDFSLVTVIARTSIMMVDSETKSKRTVELISQKSFKDIIIKRDEAKGLKRKQLNEKMNTMARSKQKGSKAAYIENEEGKLIKKDGYEHLWKNKVLKVLSKCKLNTSVVAKQQLLETWLKNFMEQDNDEIYKTLLAEIKKSDTDLKKHSNPFSRFFNLQTESFKEITNLIKERDDILSDSSTIKETEIGKIEEDSHQYFKH